MNLAKINVQGRVHKRVVNYVSRDNWFMLYFKFTAHKCC